MESKKINWHGEDGKLWTAEVTIVDSKPCIQWVGYSLNGEEVKLAGGLTPEYRVITGKRTKINPQREKQLQDGEELDYQWDTYSDDPMSRKDEVQQNDSVWQCRDMKYSQDNHVQMLTFDGVTIGNFSGAFRLSFYEGSNLIKVEVMASTQDDGVCYLYHGGLDGFTADKLYYITPKRRECLENPGFHTNSGPDRDRQRVDARGRVLTLQQPEGAVAVLPPPHRFFWASQTENIQGYNYYNLHDDGTIAIGVRHNKEAENYNVRWALYNAKPGTIQHMAFFLYVSSDSVYATRAAAMKYTNFDHLRKLPGYQRLGSHMHVASQAAFIRDMRKQRPWEILLKEVGFDIFAPCDFWAEGRHNDNKDGRKSDLERYHLESRYVSTPDFLMIPAEELAVHGKDADKQLVPYHCMVFPSHPILYSRWRDDDQEFAETLPDGRTYYHLKSADDLIEMCRREKCFIQMPHPDTKANDGLPYDVKEERWFKDVHWFGIGCRQLPADNSCDTIFDGRTNRVWNDINNWSEYPRYAMSELDTYTKVEEREEDWDCYALTNCTYLQLDKLPGSDNWQPVVDALREGRHFYSTGEILIHDSKLEDGIAEATFSWTFPLRYFELVYSDGENVSTKRISGTDTTPFGKRTIRFEFPKGMKWARVLATDIAGNSAFGMPVFLKNIK